MANTDNIDPLNFTYIDIAGPRAETVATITAAGVVGKPSDFGAIREFVLARIAALSPEHGAMVAVTARTWTDTSHGSHLDIAVVGYDA